MMCQLMKIRIIDSCMYGETTVYLKCKVLKQDKGLLYVYLRVLRPVPQHQVLSLNFSFNVKDSFTMVIHLCHGDIFTEFFISLRS